MKKIKHRINHLKHIFLFLLAGLISLILLVVLGNVIFDQTINKHGVSFGVTYSYEYALGLGLDPKKTYLEMLDELKVKRIRLSTPWNQTEPQPNVFDFTQSDFYLDEARERGIQVLLVLGAKQPGWPECKSPSWVNDLPLKERQQHTLKYIHTTIERYKNYENIWGWQVENEPLLRFGVNCDDPNREFLTAEVKTARAADPNRPIVVTDSGELRPWRTPMRLSDVFGTTLYRTVYDRFLGYLHWPIPPAFYNFKSTLARMVFAPNNQRTIISELQAEPWSPGALAETPIETQIEVFSVKDLQSNIDYGVKTGFSEIYLWGVEWWYFMKEKGHPEYLETVKKILN